jgi:site-specific DNA recombinase
VPILRKHLHREPLRERSWAQLMLAPYRSGDTAGALGATETAVRPALTGSHATAIAECDAKLARYRAALDAGADPAVVAGWIAQTQAERQRILRDGD